MSVPHHDELFVHRVDDCLDEEIDGGTDFLFDTGEDNTVKVNGGAEVDIIMSWSKCSFMI